jgi:hypothetical protein
MLCSVVRNLTSGLSKDYKDISYTLDDDENEDEDDSDDAEEMKEHISHNVILTK